MPSTFRSGLYILHPVMYHAPHLSGHLVGEPEKIWQFWMHLLSINFAPLYIKKSFLYRAGSCEHTSITQTPSLSVARCCGTEFTRLMLLRTSLFFFLDGILLKIIDARGQRRWLPPIRLLNDFDRRLAFCVVPTALNYNTTWLIVRWEHVWELWYRRTGIRVARCISSMGGTKTTCQRCAYHDRLWRLPGTAACCMLTANIP